MLRRRAVGTGTMWAGAVATEPVDLLLGARLADPPHDPPSGPVEQQHPVAACRDRDPRTRR